MKNKITKYGVVILAYMLLGSNIYAQKKHFSIIDTTKIQNMETLKFDTDYYEKNKDFDELNYTKKDGTTIRQYKSGYGEYVEEEYPPMPKLYYIYREYYLNGNIKTIGFMLRTAFPIGVWKHYDEQGKVTEENMDTGFGKFDYNKVFLFLYKEKYIDIKTGRGREEVTIGIDKALNCWKVNVWPVASNNYKGICYMLDLNTGKIKKKYKISMGEG